MADLLIFCQKKVSCLHPQWNRHLCFSTNCENKMISHITFKPLCFHKETQTTLKIRCYTLTEKQNSFLSVLWDVLSLAVPFLIFKGPTLHPLTPLFSITHTNTVLVVGCKLKNMCIYSQTTFISWLILKTLISSLHGAPPYLFVSITKSKNRCYPLNPAF